ncbi:MAG: tRNA (adenosine(37)-N6)-dimethylallyltransferase MiaA [Candidatus Latescibacteria bacterium]|nr:tRNA (adenosine(37)-N6)-dimethylallyltransferase MiaA [Candidatus Latescibacterota bacterium]
MAADFDVVVIGGPTASGKTSLGISLARALNGEIISADARQIYRYMDIGTAKPTPEERAQAVHHLIDIVDPEAVYSAAQFSEDAHQAMSNIVDEGKIPILVGGAGLYLRALFDGFSPMPDIPDEIRSRLRVESTQILSDLYARLEQVDPKWASKIQPTDRQRVVRGLEVHEATGKTLTHFQNLPREPIGGKWRTRWFGLDWPREVLYDRINARAEQMVHDGLVDEVKGLLQKGYTPELNALRTFGYREFIDHFEGRLSLDEAIESLQKGTRHYAKRQLTWFRGEDRMTWIQAGNQDPTPAILAELEA